MSGEAIVARVGEGVGGFAAADWDRCAGTDDPFLSHAFLSTLEQSGSATAETGWRPLPFAIDGPDGRPAALLPAYLKSHSQGEYVFDHGWADAWERAGGEYYPKLQIAVPFTPARPPAADPRSGAGAGFDRRGRAAGRRQRPVLGPRHLYRRERAAAV